MIKIYQTINHDPPEQIGNCFQAAMASLLEVPLEAVPHFAEKEGDFYNSVSMWLSDRGLELFEMASTHFSPSGYYLATGPSPRGNWSHTVVARQNESPKRHTIVHDPHPDGKGLDGVHTLDVITLSDVDKFMHWKKRWPIQKDNSDDT